jgi:hypothetical protein
MPVVMPAPAQVNVEDEARSTESSELGAVGPRRRNLPLDIALVIALAPLLGAAVRIWMYSGGDSALFFVLLQTLDAGPVLIGTAVLLIPTLLVVFVVTLVSDHKLRALTASWFRKNSRILSISIPLLLVIIAYTVDWLYLAIGLVTTLGAVAYYLVSRRLERRRRSRPGNNGRERPPGPDSIATFIAIVAGFLVLPGNMWLPLERISIQGEARATGYVLETTAEWTTFLTTDQGIRIIATSDVRSREICQASNNGTLAMLIQQKSASGVNCGD